MKHFLIVGFVVGLVGCATLRTTDPYKREFKAVGGSGHVVETEHIKVTYVPNTTSARIPIVVTNKTNSALKIIWDETVFLNASGVSERVFHSGVKIMDRAQPQPASIVAPQSQVQDVIVPADRVTWAYNGWVYSPICGNLTLGSAEGPYYFPEQDFEGECLGKTFGFMLTYEIDGKKRSVTARFQYANRTAIPRSN